MNLTIKVMAVREMINTVLLLFCLFLWKKYLFIIIILFSAFVSVQCYVFKKELN